MAWQQGEYITASKLNSENGSKFIGFSPVSGSGDFYIPTSAGFYYHGVSSKAFLKYEVKSWILTPTMYVEKLINGSWTVVYTRNIRPGFFNESVSMKDISNPGDGWYRVRYKASASSIQSWSLCPYQQDCVRGNYLVYYDVYTNSGNRITGEPLTVAILNSGRVGTTSAV